MGLSYVRQLDEYPTGLRRIWLLAMAVLAILIGSYEAQIAPVVPLLERDLHMSLATYGLVSSVALLAGGLAAMVAGRLTDRYGRVRLLSPCILLTGLCCFLMTLVHTPARRHDGHPYQQDLDPTNSVSTTRDNLGYAARSRRSTPDRERVGYHSVRISRECVAAVR